jgi:hypothetical protein
MGHLDRRCLDYLYYQIKRVETKWMVNPAEKQFAYYQSRTKHPRLEKPWKEAAFVLWVLIGWTVRVQSLREKYTRNRYCRSLPGLTSGPCSQSR